jgi:hypothetical protein
MGKRRKIAKRSGRTTLAEVLQTERPGMNTLLFRRAGEANRIAKIAKGRARALAYWVKDRALGQLIERGHVVVRVDQNRFPGLLSVGLSRRHRLHTHENWLNGARKGIRAGGNDAAVSARHAPDSGDRRLSPRSPGIDADHRSVITVPTAACALPMIQPMRRAAGARPSGTQVARKSR